MSYITVSPKNINDVVCAVAQNIENYLMEDAKHSAEIRGDSNEHSSSDFTIMPPLPPVEEVICTNDVEEIYTKNPMIAGVVDQNKIDELERFVPGEFAYADKYDRPYFQDAYKVISKNGWWERFRRALVSRGVNEKTGFQFTSDPFYTQIMNAIASTDIGGLHSGSSMGMTMRVMQRIALNGEAVFKKEYEKSEIIQKKLAELRGSAYKIAREIKDLELTMGATQSEVSSLRTSYYKIQSEIYELEQS